MRAVLLLLAGCVSAGAQSISYFNQGFLRQPSAQLDRNYLGIYGSNITGWGPSPPAPFVKVAGDVMSGPLTNLSIVSVRSATSPARLNFEVPDPMFPGTWIGTSLEFYDTGIFQIHPDTIFNGNLWQDLLVGVHAAGLQAGVFFGDGSGLTNIGIGALPGNVLTNNWSGNVPIIVSNRIIIAQTNDNSGLYVTNGTTRFVVATNGVMVTSGAATIGNGLTVAQGSITVSASAGQVSVTKVALGQSGNTIATSDGVSISLNAHTAGNINLNTKTTGYVIVTNAATGIQVAGTLTATNGVRQMMTNSSFASFTMTTNRQFYCLNGTNQVLTMLNAANAAGVIFRFAMTNEFGSFILTNATGAQTIRDGFSLAYTNLGVGEVGLISDGAAWWLASKGKTVMPNAQFSTSTNINFPLITNSITLQRTDYNKGQGIRLDNTGWLTAGVGSRIYIDYPGDYFLMFSAVWSKGVGSPSNGDVWLRSNSVDVANSMTLMTIQASATNVMTVSYVLPVKAPCYYDLQAASTDGNGQLQAMPAITSPFNRPACPSIIVTVNKISD